MYCNQCGHKIRYKEDYCNNCGNPIKTKKIYKFFIIIGIIILIIILYNCITNIYNNNNKERLFNQISDKYQISKNTIANYYKVSIENLTLEKLQSFLDELDREQQILDKYNSIYISKIEEAKEKCIAKTKEKYFGTKFTHLHRSYMYNNNMVNTEIIPKDITSISNIMCSIDPSKEKILRIGMRINYTGNGEGIIDNVQPMTYFDAEGIIDVELDLVDNKLYMYYSYGKRKGADMSNPYEVYYISDGNSNELEKLAKVYANFPWIGISNLTGNYKYGNMDKEPMKYKDNNETEDIENNNNSKEQNSTSTNNKDYYEPMQINNSNGINGIYKEQNSNTKYVIQDDQIEYWEEQYIYFGTIYMQDENELHIEYTSRYEYDETKDKYILERYGSTLLLKVNKDGELLKINSENELIDSNGTKYTKENDYQISIGISGYDINEETSKSYNMSIGVYVRNIEENSPADKAGVKSGDIITQFNNKTITSVEELNTLKNNCKIGDTIPLTIYRENNYITLSIVFTENN